MGYARYAVLMDLADIGGNMADGCHIASMGGTWMVAVYGFAGMRDYGGEISFDPRLPKYVDELRFPLMIRGQQIRVSITQKDATYDLESGKGLTLTHQGKKLVLKPGHPTRCKIVTPATSKRRKAANRQRSGKVENEN